MELKLLGRKAKENQFNIQVVNNRLYHHVTQRYIFVYFKQAMCFSSSGLSSGLCVTRTEKKSVNLHIQDIHNRMVGVEYFLKIKNTQGLFFKN
jgi:hypothetical protein